MLTDTNFGIERSRFQQERSPFQTNLNNLNNSNPTERRQRFKVDPDLGIPRKAKTKLKTLDWCEYAHTWQSGLGWGYRRSTSFWGEPNYCYPLSLRISCGCGEWLFSVYCCVLHTLYSLSIYWLIIMFIAPSITHLAVPAVTTNVIWINNATNSGQYTTPRYSYYCT